MFIVVIFNFRDRLVDEYRALKALYIFFFQAEDGIRDSSVTGVQTCALPICSGLRAENPVCHLAQGSRNPKRWLRWRLLYGDFHHKDFPLARRGWRADTTP